VVEVVRCPYCGFGSKFELIKTWKFRFYDVRMLECPRCGERFNHYVGVTSRGRFSEFVIRVRPRAMGGYR
jgi:transposase